AGGEAGIAWEVGLLAGLAERGTDLTAADLVIGTSAGAGVAAAISSGAGLAGLYETQLAPVVGEVSARFGPWTTAKFLRAGGPAAGPAGSRGGRGAGWGGWRCGGAPGARRRGEPSSRPGLARMTGRPGACSSPPWTPTPASS